MWECFICNSTLKTDREKEVELCVQCETETHGCSTGDCPHEFQAECDLALADLKRDQNEGEN